MGSQSGHQTEFGNVLSVEGRATWPVNVLKLELSSTDFAGFQVSAFVVNP